MCVEIDFVEHN